MNTTLTKDRLTWLCLGLMAGLAASSFWPHEPLYATSTDRNDKFAMTTCEVNLVDRFEAVFVLDFLTGQLQGATLDFRDGGFQYHFYRNIAQDFQVDPNAEPNYAILAGRAQLQGKRGITPATGVIYVAELSTGRVNAYGFPYQQGRSRNREVPPIELQPVGTFQFREASVE